jgi:hypothetical protein
VASADELIREAQYAFRNVGHGSTDEKKYKARAEKYAKRVIRKYPVSIEASQARRILDQLNVQIAIEPQPVVSPPPDAAGDFEKSHSSISGHTSNLSSAPLASDSRFQQSDNAEDWRGLIRRFMELPRNKKKMLGVIAAVAIFFPGGIFAVSGLIVFYALQTALLKKHLSLLLNKLSE